MSINAANLKYYYSGVANSSNSDPAQSIGGVKSSVELSSTALNNLFDNVTGDEAISGYDEYRLLYFQNTDTDVDGLLAPVVAWIVAQPSGMDQIEIGLANAGKNLIETAIANDHTEPVGVDWYAPSAKAGGIELPGAPYLENDFIGIWFHRIVPELATLQMSDGCQWRVEGDTI